MSNVLKITTHPATAYPLELVVAVVRRPGMRAAQVGLALRGGRVWAIAGKLAFSKFDDKWGGPYQDGTSAQLSIFGTS